MQYQYNTEYLQPAGIDRENCRLFFIALQIQLYRESGALIAYTVGCKHINSPIFHASVPLISIVIRVFALLTRQRPINLAPVFVVAIK
jgi:hypothetical protein